MKNTILLGLLAPITLSFGFSTNAQAASVILEGNYIRTAISDNGTLGYGGVTSPGLLYDATGTRNFIGDDYLTPGTPWEIFSVKSNESGLLINNNAGTTDISGTLHDNSSASTYDHSVIWDGGNDYFKITTETFFNDNDEQIEFKTVLTAVEDLTELSFLRAIDPDPDVVSGGAYATVNGRGYDANGDGDFDDPGDVAPEDWVHAEGSSTGLTVGLYSVSPVEHNTGISSSWSYDPNTYLAGTDNGNGDYTIGIAFSLGNLAAGNSITLDYGYGMGDNIVAASSGTGSSEPVPEPATMLLFGTGLAGLAGLRKRSK